MRKIVCMMGCFLLALSVSSQQTITENRFLDEVKKYHPLVKQASINIEMAKADLLSARGAFDPVIEADNRSKNFEGSRYYNYTSSELKLPLWFGADLYAGSEKANGYKLNPETTTGTVNYAGISFSPVSVIMTDKRRTALQQAKLAIKFSESEKAAMVNALLHDAAHAYWDWWLHTELLKFTDSILLNTQKRTQLVYTAFRFGDRAAIDTLEAFTQLQTLQILRSETHMMLQKTKAELSYFVFNDSLMSHIEKDMALPMRNENIDVKFDSLLNAVNLHPEIQQYAFKISSLKAERKLKMQSLLPEFSVKYQTLNTSSIGGALFNVGFNSNYRFGFTARMPLFLSSARGEYKRSKFKIEEAVIERMNKQSLLQSKLKQSYIQWQQTQKQTEIQTSLVHNFETLQRREEFKFNNGESSLFLINTREQKTFEMKQKLISLIAKQNKALADTRYFAGLF